MNSLNQAVRLANAEQEVLFGGKCASLSLALRAGLPAPDGYGLSVALVKRVAAGDATAISDVDALFGQLAPALAVRSSAVGEDSEGVSFAGQHLSVLNVMSAEAMLTAIVAVHDSAHSAEALAYRQKMGVIGEPAMAVVLQRQVASDVAGVMFTRNPISGEEERYIEASWGLGEAIVAGLVVPDSFRISADGSVIEQTAGEKDIKLVATADGRAEEVEVTAALVEALCLNAQQLGQLHQLAASCEKVYGEHLDIEWAFHDDNLFLLQCRAITR